MNIRPNINILKRSYYNLILRIEWAHQIYGMLLENNLFKKYAPKLKILIEKKNQ